MCIRDSWNTSWGLSAGPTALSCKISTVAKNIFYFSEYTQTALTETTWTVNKGYEYLILRFGTWNVPTLPQAGKMHSLAEALEIYNT